MLVNLPSKLTKHLLSRSGPCGQGLKAFPKPPTRHSLTPLGSLPRTLNQKIISKVILGGGQLSPFAWHCRISWDSRRSRLNPGKSPANLDEMVSYFLCTLETRKTWDSVEKQTFFSSLATIYQALPWVRQDHSFLAFSPLILTTK